MRLTHRVAVVTGAASGIGKEIARIFVRGSAKVAIADLNVKTFGRLDILVSNAGIQIVAPLDQFDSGKWKQMLAIHLDGPFLATRAALQRMNQQGTGGSIISMGSIHSKEASPLKGSPPSTASSGSPRSSPRKVRSTACAPTSSAPASCAHRSLTSRFPSKRESSA
jgi:3-hydroxybutyrate dehydrogenase